MDTKIKDTVILCPECGAPGLFTCTNCKHQIRFSMQWKRAKEEPEDKSDRLKKKEPEKESSGPAVDKAAEESAKEDKDSTAGEVKKRQTKKSDTPSGDVPEEQSKEKEDETWNKSVYII